MAFYSNGSLAGKTTVFNQRVIRLGAPFPNSTAQFCVFCCLSFWTTPFTQALILRTHDTLLEEISLTADYYFFLLSQSTYKKLMLGNWSSEAQDNSLFTFTAAYLPKSTLRLQVHSHVNEVGCYSDVPLTCELTEVALLEQKGGQLKLATGQHRTPSAIKR